MTESPENTSDAPKKAPKKAKPNPADKPLSKDEY